MGTNSLVKESLIFLISSYHDFGPELSCMSLVNNLGFVEVEVVLSLQMGLEGGVSRFLAKTKEQILHLPLLSSVSSMCSQTGLVLVLPPSLTQSS